jgi:hypothetical protein
VENSGQAGFLLRRRGRGDEQALLAGSFAGCARCSHECVTRHRRDGTGVRPRSTYVNTVAFPRAPIHSAQWHRLGEARPSPMAEAGARVGFVDRARTLDWGWPKLRWRLARPGRPATKRRARMRRPRLRVVFPLSPSQGGSLSAYFRPFAVSPDGRTISCLRRNRFRRCRPPVASLFRLVRGSAPGGHGRGPVDRSGRRMVSGLDLRRRQPEEARVTTGGVTQTVVSNVVTSGGATRGARDDIVFAKFASRYEPRIGRRWSGHAREGGIRESVLSALSDGRHFINTSRSRNASRPRAHRRRFGSHVDDACCWHVRPYDDDEAIARKHTLASSFGYSRGHEFFAQDGALYARPFDEQRLDFTGSANRLVDGIPMAPRLAPRSSSLRKEECFWPRRVARRPNTFARSSDGNGRPLLPRAGWKSDRYSR